MAYTNKPGSALPDTTAHDDKARRKALKHPSKMP